MARWNRSFVHLLKGDYLNGWADFEYRFRIPQCKSLYPFRLKGARWNGETDPEATIFVHDEQGLGDTFQFVRYLPLVKQRCGRLIFETRRSLTGLLSANLDVDEMVVRRRQATAGNVLRLSCRPDEPAIDFPNHAGQSSR